MIELSNLSKKLKRETKVALFCHIRPDGDSIGSAVALSLALKKLDINCDVYSFDAIPKRYFFLEDVKDVKVFDATKKYSFENYSALVAIDCGDLTRLGDFQEEFSKHKNTFNIDHHISNTHFAKVNYVVDLSANAQNIYYLIKEMGVEIDESIANLLAMGLITDTGNFKHKNVTSSTLYVAGDLLERGADINKIHYNMFTKQTKARAKLFGLVMSKIKYFLDERLAVATVTQQDITSTGALADETEGFIDFVMGIDGVEVGICLLEVAKNSYKASFRSKGADVNAVASAFGGGGHVLASGAKLNGEYYEILDKLCFEVSKNLKD